MPVLAQQFLQQNLAPPQYQEKMTVYSKDISLDRLLSKDTGPHFEVHYAVAIMQRGNQIDPSKPITPSTVNMDSLRTALLGKIREQDRKYMVLYRFDTRKCIFRFNYVKWLNDATRGMAPRTNVSRFKRDFSFKVAPPPMLLTDFVSIPIEKFILKKFMDWMESSRKEAKYFKYLIPPNFRQNLRSKFRNMFEWEYNKQWNQVTATLKPVYVLALLYATGQAVKSMKDLKKSDVKSSNERLFADKVKKNINSFDRNKWEKFIKKRFI